MKRKLQFGLGVKKIVEISQCNSCRDLDDDDDDDLFLISNAFLILFCREVKWVGRGRDGILMWDVLKERAVTRVEQTMMVMALAWLILMAACASPALFSTLSFSAIRLKMDMHFSTWVFVSFFLLNQMTRVVHALSRA
ncbi:hypothetical protein SUGI_0471240 [Cryptomeria japonica]|nr:hypothetical protein SUGI_0471240 [Cryptomeria japonica]